MQRRMLYFSSGGNCSLESVVIWKTPERVGVGLFDFETFFILLGSQFSY
jgi:hypothetical protein